MEELVSIIVPVYNGEKYLTKCLDSLLNQTYKNIEIIIINDGSTDKTLDICKSYQNQFSNIKLIDKENEGVSVARNVGIKYSEGKYIIFCDCDDYVAKNFVKYLVSMIITYNSDMSCCSYKIFYGEEETAVRNKNDITICSGDDMYFNVLLNTNCSGYLWNKLFIRDIIIKNHLLFSKSLAILEDELFVISYLNTCNKLCLGSKELYFYRYNTNSSLNQRLSNKKLTSVYGRESIYSLIKKYVSNNDLIERVWNDLMQEYCLSYKKVFFSNLDTKREWMNYIKKGFLTNKGKMRMNSTWHIKEKIYYCFLYIHCFIHKI